MTLIAGVYDAYLDNIDGIVEITSLEIKDIMQEIKIFFDGKFSVNFTKFSKKVRLKDKVESLLGGRIMNRSFGFDVMNKVFIVEVIDDVYSIN